MKNSPEINLESLYEGMPAVTPAYGRSLAEAGAVCLDEVGHQSGVEFQVKGLHKTKYKLLWPAVTPQMKNCYNDLQDSTEYGAYGIAFLLLKQLTNYTVIQRSKKGPGFDYWLGKEGGTLFQDKARLEVSGILKGTASKIASRVKQKLTQVAPSDGTFPAYVVIVEFGSPLSQVAIK
ncbi:MAG: hypothetical protein JJE30_18075 [Desulfuromonadales bacterium]|nr:hypothetical protein [Desulfuromonadales bacterium]